MSKPTRFEHNHYLGDKRRLVVHDLDHTAEGCGINQLVASERFLTFGPDTLAEARNRGYKPCKVCVTPSEEPEGRS